MVSQYEGAWPIHAYMSAYLYKLGAGRTMTKTSDILSESDGTEDGCNSSDSCASEVEGADHAK